jgi:hypothetical protein
MAAAILLSAIECRHAERMSLGSRSTDAADTPTDDTDSDSFFIGGRAFLLHSAGHRIDIDAIII